MVDYTVLFSSVYDGILDESSVGERPMPVRHACLKRKSPNISLENGRYPFLLIFARTGSRLILAPISLKRKRAAGQT